ncbi:DUF1488 family protein [Labrys portucalensis]|uniref:DUF1488 family protein n=1 Tax=Labrys neptuniae TaxID=376174 RepID=A0ABV6Z9C6_9HYPH
MPLTPTDEIPFEVFERDSLQFWMQDGRERVRCLVSRAYLDDLGPGMTNNVADLIARFDQHRAFFESMASRKYDAGMIEDGYVMITNRDFGG